LDVNVELYDPNSDEQEAYEEDDCKCNIIIIDEDKPGTIVLEMGELKVTRKK